MGMAETDKVAIGEVYKEGLIQNFLSEQAAKHGIWLVGGTVPIQSRDAKKVYAACLLFNDAGEVVARYDKIHLFDVTLAESGESYTESETIACGDDIVVTETPFGRLGLAICYDLRFPEIFRAMSDSGVDIIALPSSFTSLTGKAHWETLIRARAIENLSYVVAAAQGGYHVNGRETHGDSMIVDPWGMVLNRLPHGTGVVISEIDVGKLKKTRKLFPALEHRRLNCKISYG